MLVADGGDARSRRLGPTLVVPAVHPVLGQTFVVVARGTPRRPFDEGDLDRVREFVAAASNGAPPRGAQAHVQAVRVPPRLPLGALFAVPAEPPAEIRLEAVAGGSALRAAFDVAPAGMSLLDTALRYRWVNLALCATLGRDRHALLGLSVEDIVDPAHADRAAAFFARLRGGGSPGVRDRIAFARPDGRRVWADVGGSLFTAPGDPPLFLVQQFDVTADHDRAEELAHRAMHDDLTGLANRAVLRERLQLVLARRGEQRVVAFFLDIDGFKKFNDAYGHSVGDAVLCEVADRLAAVIRDGDTVARVGGDEFVVAGEVVDADEAGRIAERIAAAFRSPVPVGERALVVTVSVGVALSVPGDSPEDLVDRADQALLAEKHRGPRRFVPSDLF
ncbi:MAG TPA: sensor domain-containing diguanylate cyclase [Frankiaceae bacterium]|nr:sensor domain-containing diguanylate cyclase [Frankiaceae bacterium]